MSDETKKAVTYRFEPKTLKRIKRAAREYETTDTAAIRKVFKDLAERKGWE